MMLVGSRPTIYGLAPMGFYRFIFIFIFYMSGFPVMVQFNEFLYLDLVMDA